MSLNERDLNAVQRQIWAAKQETFRAQDAADVIGDADLRVRLNKAREWLEAADRRQAALRLAPEREEA